jgi:hypothetical protein
MRIKQKINKRDDASYRQSKRANEPNSSETLAHSTTAAISLRSFLDRGNRDREKGPSQAFISRFCVGHPQDRSLNPFLQN